MKRASELNIRRDENGDADLEYYTALAHRLRAQQISKIGKRLSLAGFFGAARARISGFVTWYVSNLLSMRVYARSRNDGVDLNKHAGDH